MVAAKSFIST